MSDIVDLRVTIQRVRVRCQVQGATRPSPVFVTGYLTPGARPAPSDHAITIRELQIDVEAALDTLRARSLGKQIASQLADQLAELQDRRPSGGPIHVETLRVHLRGEVARHPTSAQISAALMTAFESRIQHGA